MQRQVQHFIDTYNLQNSIDARFIDLVSEIGELGKELLKGSEYGKKPYIVTDLAQEEVGDCLFSLLALCESMNLNAETALKIALAKYEARFAKKGQISSDK